MYSNTSLAMNNFIAHLHFTVHNWIINYVKSQPKVQNTLDVKMHQPRFGIKGAAKVLANAVDHINIFDS